VLLNAAPDLRAQLAATPALHPRAGLRDSPIKAVVLSGAEIDQVAGLLTLRERQAFTIYATDETLGALAANPMFDALAGDCVTRQPVLPDVPFRLVDELEAEIFQVPGKIPLYLERGTPDVGAESGANVGVAVRSGDKQLVFVPGAAALTSVLKARFAAADVLLFDGTLFDDDEMIRSGTGPKTGRRMGHMPIAGPDGSLAALSGTTARRIYIHINNTNPVLVEGSAERQTVEAAGWEVAEDGQEIVL
jgi:pyrroloquinoline quinone biosynthesis protein B